MKLLIDENLSPRLVQFLGDKGVAAQHVVHVGLSGATDPQVWRYAYEHDQVVVTINASDFLELAGSVDLHPGLIVLRSRGLSREEQWHWLNPVVDWLIASGKSLVNEAVVLTGAGKFSVQKLPRTR